LVRLRVGDFFGEKALLEDTKRSATVKTRTEVVIYHLKKEDFIEILKHHFDVLPKMREASQLAEFLSQIALFSPFSLTQLLYMAYKMTKKEFQAGNLILKQGDGGETFYVIEEGEAEVLFQIETTELKPIARLGKGECFGEMALLKTGIRAATVQASTNLICYELSKADFDLLFGGCQYKRGKLEKLILRREEDLKKKVV